MSDNFSCDFNKKVSARSFSLAEILVNYEKIFPDKKSALIKLQTEKFNKQL